MVPSRHLLFHVHSARRPQWSPAQDVLSSNHKLSPLPGRIRRHDPCGSPSQGSSARRGDCDRLDWAETFESALDNRIAPAPPSALPQGRARVARGSYAGTFPYVRGLASTSTHSKTVNTFAPLGTRCAAVRERAAGLWASGGIRRRFDRNVTARQWAPQKSARPIANSIHEALQPLN